MEKSDENKVMSLKVTEELSVKVIPHSEYEFLMSTKEVATGYGTTKYSIFKALNRCTDDFVEGKHFLRGVELSSTPGVQTNSILWTKRGIVRMGFFIKSKQAKIFRDFVEELVIKADESQTHTKQQYVRTLPPTRRHNRLTPERLIDIMADVCLIDDKELRTRISSKLMGKEVRNGTSN